MATKSALPLLALGAAALLVMARKKGESTAAQTVIPVTPTKPPPGATKTSGPSGKSASSETWKQRQTALAFVAGMKVCNCHPGTIDGVYGPATLNAVIAFQVCTGIDVDGKWGPQTEAMMKKVLAQIAEGQVYVKKTAKSTTTTKKEEATSTGSIISVSDDGEFKIPIQWRYTYLEPRLDEEWKKRNPDFSLNKPLSFGFGMKESGQYLKDASILEFDPDEGRLLSIENWLWRTIPVTNKGKTVTLNELHKITPNLDFVSSRRRSADIMSEPIGSWIEIYVKSKISQINDSIFGM